MNVLSRAPIARVRAWYQDAYPDDKLPELSKGGR
jgi:hypothetical protein